MLGMEAGGMESEAGSRASGEFSTRGGMLSREMDPGKKGLRRGDTRGLKFLRRTRVLESSKLKEPVNVVPPPRRVVVPPRATYKPPPGYPRNAQKNEEEGFVRVEMFISPSGAVAEFNILQAEPPGIFEKAVEEVVPLWRFSPALDNFNKPIKCRVEYKFGFKLEDARR
jgi:TonB family protein